MGNDDPQAPETPIPLMSARDAAHGVPTPVRASLGEENDLGHPDGLAAKDVPVALEMDGVDWTVDVGGISRSGAASAAASILLLRFRTTDGTAAEREAWVVAKRLADLTELQLDEAFRSSTPAPDPWLAKPIFPEAGSRSGRDG